MTATDALTGLPPRGAFRSELERLIRFGEPVGILLLDLDSFAVVNCLVGHDRGDWLLRRAGQAIADIVPEGARVYRTAGDEFAVLLLASIDKDLAGLGERICATVAAIEIPHLGGADPASHLSSSIGVAHCPADGQVADELLEVADRAMVFAKALKRAYHDELMSRM